MRIHTNALTLSDFHSALLAEQSAGRIAQSVTYKTLDTHRSNSHARAFEVQLSAAAKAPGDGRRAGNSGSYGAGDAFAATYDEWGWLLSAVYHSDPNALVGTPRSPVYRDAGDFDTRTGMTYNPDSLLADIEQNGGDPFPFRIGSDRVGRRGYGRSDGDYTPWGTLVPAGYVDRALQGSHDWITYAPRTAAWVRDFAAAVTR